MKETLSTTTEKKKRIASNLREKIFLAEQAGAGGIRVLPGEKWAYYFKEKPEVRQEKLEGLLSGKYTPEEVEEYLKPNALIYDANDLETKGVEAVSSRILSETSVLSYYDYRRYADFLKGLEGLSITPEKATEMYEELTKGRTQKTIRDAQSSAGKRKIDMSLREESQQMLEQLNTKERTGKVLDTLKLDWMCEELGVVGSAERDHALSKLSGDERELFHNLKDDYRKFSQSGDTQAYDSLTKHLKNGLSKIEKPITGEGSESMKELEKELESFDEEVGPPGSENDPAIPPEDQDEYHTPDRESQGDGKKEKGPGKFFFEIEPPLAGHFAAGKKSYFDIDRKVWSKKKSLSPFINTSFLNDKRHTMKGVTGGGVIAIPLPTGYALDLGSSEIQGKNGKIFRDQNGCFYIETDGPGSFKLSFGKEMRVFAGNPVAEDVQLLYRGMLSQNTETKLGRLTGGPLEKAEQLRQFLLANHFYPGGGDLDMAQKVQAKLRKENTGNTYVQALDTSEYLECYSANTLFIALLRKAGISARLVCGHHVQGSKHGKSYMNENSGHAWAEVWDGRSWRRFDATPLVKQEDKKQDDEKGEGQDRAPSAEDGGVDSPQEKQEQKEKEEGEKGEDKKDGQESTGEGGMEEASDEDIEKGKQDLSEAKDALEKAEQAKQDMQEDIKKVDSFKDLEKMKEEIEKNPELLDDMKDALKDMLEAKEDLMKDEIKDRMDQMEDDGFLDEEKREEMLKKLESEMGEKLDQLKKKIEEENKIYNSYEEIQREIEPLVDEWFEYFIEKLPREKEVLLDEDSLSRQGAFSRRSVNRPRNILFGTVKNPRIIDETVKPLFLASIMVDVSGSMAGEKLKSAQKLLIFYSELFTKIQNEFGYIKFAINTFSDSMKEIKSFDQEYDSTEAYLYPDKTRSTVKVRLMKGIQTEGGTNMLDPIKRASQALTKETFDNPDFASAFYFIGDGEDTSGNSGNVKKFLEAQDSERGFGNHMLSAILLGSERERGALANIFGDEHTTVAGNFDDLIKESMERFDDDIEEYLRNKTH